MEAPQAKESSSPEETPEETGNEETDHLALTPLESLMLQSIDQVRQQAGLPSLQVHDKLVDLARQRSQDMAEKGYFGHVAPDGTTARSLMVANGLGPGIMGEILGRNNSPDPGQSVTSVVRAFTNSPSHYGAIVNPRFVAAGVGTALAAGNMKYYTILFLGP